MNRLGRWLLQHGTANATSPLNVARFNQFVGFFQLGFNRIRRLGLARLRLDGSLYQLVQEVNSRDSLLFLFQMDVIHHLAQMQAQGLFLLFIPDQCVGEVAGQDESFAHRLLGFRGRMIQARLNRTNQRHAEQQHAILFVNLRQCWGGFSQIA